jgi:hypothetical protein
LATGAIEVSKDGINAIGHELIVPAVRPPMQRQTRSYGSALSRWQKNAIAIKFASVKSVERQSVKVRGKCPPGKDAYWNDMMRLVMQRSRRACESGKSAHLASADHSRWPNGATHVLLGGVYGLFTGNQACIYFSLIRTWRQDNDFICIQSGHLKCAIICPLRSKVMHKAHHVAHSFVRRQMRMREGKFLIA